MSRARGLLPDNDAAVEDELTARIRAVAETAIANHKPGSALQDLLLRAAEQFAQSVGEVLKLMRDRISGNVSFATYETIHAGALERLMRDLVAKEQQSVEAELERVERERETINAEIILAMMGGAKRRTKRNTEIIIGLTRALRERHEKIAALSARRNDLAGWELAVAVRGEVSAALH